MKALWLILLILTAAPAFATPASKDKDLGGYGAWHAYAYQEGGQTVCYMVTTKTTRPVEWKKRKTPYLMITHRPVEASTDVISYGAGTSLDASRNVRLRLGNALFDLFSVRDTAWARDALTDHKITRIIRASSLAQFASHADQKNIGALNDSFDLQGGDAAYYAITKACGLPKPQPLKAVAAKVGTKQVFKKPVVKKTTPKKIKKSSPKKIVKKKVSKKKTIKKKATKPAKKQDSRN